MGASDVLKRTTDRRTKGYERVELDDPDSPAHSSVAIASVAVVATDGATVAEDLAELASLSRNHSHGDLVSVHSSAVLSSSGGGQRGIHILCCVHFVQYVALNMTVLVYPKLVNFLVNGNMAVTSESSFAAGRLIFANSFSQFLSVKFWSVSSDSHGRKPYIVMGMVALSCFALIFACGKSVGALAVGFTIEGTFSPGWTMGQAYIVDASEPHRRAENYALYYGIAQGAAIGVGAILGLLLLSLGGLRWPFLAAAALLLINIPLTACLLPESLQAGGRPSWSWSRATSKGHPWASISMSWRRSAHLAELLVAFVLAQTSYLFLPNTWINFTDAAFGWSTSEAGASIILFGLGIAVAPRLLIGWLGEVQAMMKGVQLMGLSFALLALSGLGGVRSSWIVWPAVLIASCGMMFDSAMRTYISRNISESEQGSLQGTLAALGLLSNCAAGFISNHALVHHQALASL